ncbi:MAG: hypothetical protein MAG471_01635 [Acidimicrobiaceae bacterium]|nr:hypothetical protein [Acidimicrobiaceae bacterium]
MCSGTIPVALDGLGVNRGVNPELLGDAVEQVAGHPDLVADAHGVTGSDLELPLAEHHLGVGAGDLEAGVEAGLGVGLDNLATGYLDGANSAVVGALWGRVALDRPSQRAPLLEEGVLLFDTEDRLLVAVPLERLDARCTRVGGVGCHLAIRQADVAEHQHVVATADGVGTREHRPEDTVGVVARGLVGARAVEPPDRIVGGSLVEDLGLGTNVRQRCRAVDPDVFSPYGHWLHSPDRPSRGTAGLVERFIRQDTPGHHDDASMGFRGCCPTVNGV